MVMPVESTDVPVGCGPWTYSSLITRWPSRGSPRCATSETDSGAFRAALHELTTMLVYEAARSFAGRALPDHDAGGARAEGTRLANPPLIVPVLRAGLGHGRLGARAAAGVVDGLRRPGPRRARPSSRGPTWSRCRGDLAGMPVLVLDPMLATGGSLMHCCRLLAERGCTDITVCCVLAAPEGIERLARVGAAAAPGDRRDRRGAQRQDVHRARPRRRRRPPVRRHAAGSESRHRRAIARSPGRGRGRYQALSAPVPARLR